MADDYYGRFQLFKPDEITYNADDERYTIDENHDGIADYGYDKPDFNALFFLSNFVARWEYLPGSSVYLVWSQGRDEFANTGKFNFKNDMSDLFKVFPHDVFLIKLSYRFQN